MFIKHECVVFALELSFIIQSCWLSSFNFDQTFISETGTIPCDIFSEKAPDAQTLTYRDIRLVSQRISKCSSMLFSTFWVFGWRKEKAFGFLLLVRSIRICVLWFLILSPSWAHKMYFWLDRNKFEHFLCKNCSICHQFLPLLDEWQESAHFVKTLHQICSINDVTKKESQTETSTNDVQLMTIQFTKRHLGWSHSRYTNLVKSGLRH